MAWRVASRVPDARNRVETHGASYAWRCVRPGVAPHATHAGGNIDGGFARRLKQCACHDAARSEYCATKHFTSLQGFSGRV